MSGKGRSDKGENCEEDHTREKTVRKLTQGRKLCGRSYPVY